MLLKTKNNIKLTIEEQKLLYNKCRKIKFNIPVDVTIIKNSKLSHKKGSGMAMFSMLHPNTIYICSDEDVEDEDLIGKIGHELIHRADYFTYNFLQYVFMVQPGIRNIYLEPQAYEYEKYIKKCFRTKTYMDSVANAKLRKKEHLDRKNSS